MAVLFFVPKNSCFKFQLYSNLLIKLLLAVFFVNCFCLPSHSVVSFFLLLIRCLISFFSVRNFKFLDDQISSEYKFVFVSCVVFFSPSVLFSRYSATMVLNSPLSQKFFKREF